MHWADGGETRLDNLLLLCRRHHTLVHEAGYSIETTSGGVAFLDPAGRLVPRTDRRPATSVDEVRRAHRRLGLHLDAETNLPRWEGAPPDYGACIDGLLTVPAWPGCDAHE